MEPTAYAFVINAICNELGLHVADTTLVRNVTAYCKRLNLRKMASMHETEESLHAHIAKSYIDSIKPEEEDKTFAKQIEEATGVSPPSAKVEAPSPLITWLSSRMTTIASKVMHLYIDSRLRQTINYNGSDIVDFAFSLVPRHQSRGDFGSGQLQVPVSPAKVTYFKIGKIILPYPTSYRDRNLTKEVTLTFSALRSNGILAHEDTYHFTFVYSIVNDEFVELTPANEYCKFSTPISYLDDLTLRFNDPLFPIHFLPDRMQPDTFNYLSSDGRIVFTNHHTLATGDVIMVKGLTTGNDSENASLLDTINDRRGIVITRINDNVIATNIDFTNLISPDANAKPMILFYNRMFRFPLEIGYQDDAHNLV
jgi:hypothetical protein